MSKYKITVHFCDQEMSTYYGEEVGVENGVLVVRGGKGSLGATTTRTYGFPLSNMFVFVVKELCDEHAGENPET